MNKMSKKNEMIYSLNPFKWLFWLYRCIKHKGTKWPTFFHSKPLNGKGLSKVRNDIKATFKDYTLSPPTCE